MKLWNSTLNTVSPKGRATKARDARVKAELIRLFGNVCYFAEMGWHTCPHWIPENRQAIEHMHIHGKRTHIGGAKTVRFDIGFSILGCWFMHDEEHIHHRLTLDGSIAPCRKDDCTDLIVEREIHWGKFSSISHMVSEVIE